MRELEINKGLKVILDDEDFDRVAALKWFYGKNNYIGRNNSKTIDGKKRYTKTRLHWFVLRFEGKKGYVVDHINGNTFDNRKENLRICTVAENSRNQKLNKRNKTGYKGVCAVKRVNGYKAEIKLNYKVRHLGYFKCPKEAAKAYNKAAIELFGEFARLNIVD